MAPMDDHSPSLRRFYGGRFGRLPWWVALLLALATVGVGAAITAKPFQSLGVLIALVAAAFIIVGVSEFLAASDRGDQLTGVAWIAVGIVIAAWPGLGLRGLLTIIGITLLAGGLLRVLSGLRGRHPDGRMIPVLSGGAKAIFGILALSWPDVTLLVTALLVGPAMMLFGFGQTWTAIRRRRQRDSSLEGHAGRRAPTWLRATAGAGALVASLGLLGVSAAIHNSSGEPDAFYDAPDDPPKQAGTLIRSEAFSTAVPDGASAWRILYTTTRDDRTPAVASAIVMVADDAPDGPRPVIAWAHGTTGFAEKCAPSLLKDPFQAGAMPAKEQVLDRGWVVVAADYVGLGTEGPHPYLVGEPVGRSVLDAVRAARQLDDVELESRTVVWGHSQGGGAALWTGILAPSYAPDANVIGVAALAPATRLSALFDLIKDSPVGKIMGSYVVSAYSEVYDDVSFNDYVRPAAQVLARETAGRCLSGPEALVSVGTAVGEETYFSQSPASGPLGKRLAENVPSGAIEAPLMIAQGLTDALVLPAEQETFVKERCDAGQRMQYRTYAGLDHVGVVLSPTSKLIPDLLTWTEDRLAGTAQPPGCERVAG